MAKGFSGGTNYGVGKGAYYEGLDAKVVDTRSGAMWRDAITSIGEATSNVIDKQTENISRKRKRAQELMDRTMKYTLEETARVYDNLQKQGVNNPSIYANVDKLLPERFNYFSQAASADTPEEQKAALDNLAKTTKQLTSLSSLISQGTESTDLFNKDVQSGNLLGQGTLNLSGEKNTQWAKMMNIRSGYNEGTEEWGIDEDGEWTVTYNGPELDGPVTEKAALFFGYDPGTIPEVDKFFTELYQEIGATNKNNEPTDKFLNTRNVLQATNDKNFSQVAYNVKMGALATATASQIGAYAKSIAHSLPDAEAVWDNVLPESIKREVAKTYGVEDYEDLKPGSGSGYGQLDKISGEMLVRATQLYGETRMPKQRLGALVKNVQPPAASKAMIDEMKRTQDWQVFKQDFDLKASQFGIGVNDEGVYTGEIDIDADNFAEALNTIGFKIIGDKENKGTDDNYFIGLEVESANGKKVTIRDEENSQDFVAKLLRSMGATYGEGAGPTGGYQYNKTAKALLSKYSN